MFATLHTEGHGRFKKSRQVTLLQKSEVALCSQSTKRKILNKPQAAQALKHDDGQVAFFTWVPSRQENSRIQTNFGSRDYYFDSEENEKSKTNECVGMFVGLTFHKKSALRELDPPIPCCTIIKYRVSQKFVPLISCAITFDRNFIFT